LAQDPPEGRFEVIVADGMSDDGTRAILERLAKKDSRVRMIDNPGRIVSTGLNEAIRAARGKIIIRLDAHTVYAPDYVKQCVSVLEETGADNVGGPRIAKGKGFLGRAIAAAFQSPFAVGGAKAHDPLYEGALDTVFLGCWPREVFDRVGLFDEELVRNQDDEFNLRLTRAGGKIWQSPRIKSCYWTRASFKNLFQQYKQYGYWKIPVIRKHGSPASVRHLIPGSFVLSLVILPVVALWWPVMAIFWLALMGTYSAANIGVSFLTAARSGWVLLPMLPLIFFCLHFAYGYGFLRGICDFVLLGRAPGRVYTVITRT
jgi:glycosyltransferase involved in cell wall biosynthesis